MARLRKGGPKKKTGPRDGEGRLIHQDDLGTDELRAKKLIMTGSTREEMSSLGVLRGRGIIDDEQYEYGVDFERCYRAYIGRPDPAGSSFERRDRGSDDSSEAHIRRMKVRYWNCLAALGAVGPHVFNLVRDVCLYERSGGLMGAVVAADIRRMDGILIARRAGGVPPEVRLRIGMLTRGLEALGELAAGDYSREAEQLIERLRRQA